MMVRKYLKEQTIELADYNKTIRDIEKLSLSKLMKLGLPLTSDPIES